MSGHKPSPGAFAIRLSESFELVSCHHPQPLGDVFFPERSESPHESIHAHDELRFIREFA